MRFLPAFLDHQIISYLLGQSLAENTELEVINLADNKISSFQVKIPFEQKMHIIIKLFIEGYYHINSIT